MSMTRNLRRGDVGVRAGSPPLDATGSPPPPRLGRPRRYAKHSLPQRHRGGHHLQDREARTRRISARVQSPEGSEMGLLRDSLITLDTLATPCCWIITDVRGTCPIMAEVDEALRTVRGLHRP